jgi:hypothetical protein
MITECRACGSGNLWPFLDLGDQPLPRFPERADADIPHAPLKLVKCESCQLVQLSDSVPRDLLFKKFWYRSGISPTISADLKQIASEGAKTTDGKGVALDIGCNDGTLLSYLPNTMTKVGFEPAANVGIIASSHARVFIDYFRPDSYLAKFEKAQLITSVAMFYDLEDPLNFCKQVAACLADDGVWIVQQNYLGLMLQNTAYDNICHEHLTYFSLASLQPLLAKAKLHIYHAEINSINGGSIKTCISHYGSNDIDGTVSILAEEEKRHDLSDRKVYRDFSYRVRLEAEKLRSFLSNNSEKTMIYGAGTRGATIFKYSYHGRVVAAVDNNREKHGRYYLDTKTPIISREQALNNPPDYFLVLPYHLADEIIAREKPNFPGAKWIVPLPEFRVV